MEELEKLEADIERVIGSFERSEEKACLTNQTTGENNRKVFGVMRRLFGSNLVPLHLILCMLSDADLFSMAATCKTLHKYLRL